MATWKYKKLHLVVSVSIVAFLFVVGVVQANSSVFIPTTQQEDSSKAKGIFLIGKEAEAKLLEMGFTKEQIAQKRQESLNKRQEERITSGLGGSSESLNCNAGHGAISVFVADGSFFAYFVTTNAAAANPLSNACDDCLVYHQIFGESGISVYRHDVSAPWAEHWWAWCT